MNLTFYKRCTGKVWHLRSFFFFLNCFTRSNSKRRILLSVTTIVIMVNKYICKLLPFKEYAVFDDSSYRKEERSYKVVILLHGQRNLHVYPFSSLYLLFLHGKSSFQHVESQIDITLNDVRLVSHGFEHCSGYMYKWLLSASGILRSFLFPLFEYCADILNEKQGCR